MPCATHPDVLTGLERCSSCGKDFCQDCVISLQGSIVCAGCKTGRVKDIQSGVADGLDLIGPGARLGGAIVDGIVVGIGMFALLIPLGLFSFDPKAQEEAGMFGALAMLAAAIVIPTVYEGLMLGSRGQTLGKMAIKAKVVNADGSALAGWQPWVRGLSRTVMSATRILGLIDSLMIFSKNRATLHDRLAKTRVVRVG